MYFITIFCNTYSCNILIDVQCLNFFYVYKFSGVPPLKIFWKFTIDSVTLPVENTTLMVALLSLQPEGQSFYSCEEMSVLTLVCPTYQLVVSVA